MAEQILYTEETPEDQIDLRFPNFGKELWRTLDDFKRATDEQRAHWKELCEKYDAHNKIVTAHRLTLKNKILAEVEQLWGKKSKQFRYIYNQRATEGFPYRWTSRYHDLVKEMEKANENQAREAKKLKEERERKVEEEQDIIALVEICVRRGFGATNDADLVLDCLEQLDPKLAMANVLHLCRNNWSEYDIRYVRNAFHKWEPQTPDEKKIAESIQDGIDNWDCDGRVFRSDYEALYKLVDAELLGDNNIVEDIIDRREW